MDRLRSIGPGLEGAGMRIYLQTASLAVAATGALMTMTLPAAGVQAGTVHPAAGQVHLAAGQVHLATRPFPGRVLPIRPALSASYNTLYGVFCTSKTSCWAVGQRYNGTTDVNQIVRWNGRSWRQAKTPYPGGAGKNSDSELFAVRCLTSKDCWAVGEYLKGTAWLGEALHWNGKRWQSIAVPAVGGTGKDAVTELDDSTCISANSCWAVGDFGLGSAPPEKVLNLTLHWNGKKWSHVRTPNPGGTRLTDFNYLNSVRCVSATDCNAVGSYGSLYTAKNITLNEVFHWNGKIWSWVHVVNPGGTGSKDVNQLDELACGGPASCWAAGYYGEDTNPAKYLNLMLHWNGSKWSRAVVPNPAGALKLYDNFLYAATCDGPVNCWAVGDAYNKTRATVNEALHWNGKHWSVVSTPDPAGTQSLDQNELYGVRCTSSSNCWAVGTDLPYLGNVVTSEILHWNGKHWSIYPA
jgi:hypothetical protein